MGKRGGNSGMSAGSGSGKADEIQSQIDKLKEENEKLMAHDYSGRKGWDKQLDSDVKKVAKNNKKIDDLQKQLKAGQNVETKKKPEKKPTAGEFKWQRAGEGWYVGKGGYEIRESDSGGFDVVKVKGSSASTVKHFSSLKDARKYSPEAWGGLNG